MRSDPDQVAVVSFFQPVYFGGRFEQNMAQQRSGFAVPQQTASNDGKRASAVTFDGCV